MDESSRRNDELDDHRFLRELLGDVDAGKAGPLEGPGDDCARIDASGTLYVTTDALVEGRHYDAATARIEQVAAKLVNRSFSDLAAMGAWPVRVLAGFVFGPGWGRRERQDFYRAVDGSVRQRGARWVGGDLAATDGPSVFHLVAIGEPCGSRAACRSGLEPGDALLVSGPLGGSLVRGRHLDFEPRLDFARALVARHDVHAMIDLSDGLLLDLSRLLEASSRRLGVGLGAQLDLEKIPIHDDARAQPDPVEAALTDGEDYELLFGVAQSSLGAILADSSLQGVRRIGTVEGRPGVRTARADGTTVERRATGFVHEFSDDGNPEPTRNEE